MAPECLFCKIAAGEIPAAVVSEDADTLAFLDIAPLRPGHTLVIPKAHGAKLADLSGSQAAAILATARRINSAICAAADAPDALMALHDGPAAGQEVPHVHLHIVPRRAGDGAGPVHALFGDRPAIDGESLAALAADIQARLGA